MCADYTIHFVNVLPRSYARIASQKQKKSSRDYCDGNEPTASIMVGDLLTLYSVYVQQRLTAIHAGKIGTWHLGFKLAGER